VDDTAVADLVDWLTTEHARLARTDFPARGYAGRHVDALFAELTDQLGRGELPEPSRVRTAQFPTGRNGRRNYRMPTLDDLLDEVVRRLLVIRGGAKEAPTSEAAAMIERIEHARFTTVRSGYDCREVDEFLEQAIEMLLRGQQPGPRPAFTISRRGYAPQDVDAFTSALHDHVL
jgi:DivIVA domain-containing protein